MRLDTLVAATCSPDRGVQNYRQDNCSRCSPDCSCCSHFHRLRVGVLGCLDRYSRSRNKHLIAPHSNRVYPIPPEEEPPDFPNTLAPNLFPVASYDSDLDPDPDDLSGLRVVGFDSESETYEPVPEIPLCWDCLQLEDDEVEWEEVAERDNTIAHLDINELIEESGDRTLQWEVLMAVSGIEVDPEEYHDGFIYTDEHDYDQHETQDVFGDMDSVGRVPMPAARSVVEALPTVVVERADHQCAVCKDGMAGEESRVRKLPCEHLFHEDCILPWLRMKNTCPLCRYELPTDDPEHPRWKAPREDARELPPAQLRHELESWTPVPEV